jgi:hypothetical protein
MRAAWLTLVPALVILCLAAAPNPENVRGHDDHPSPKLVGSWEVTVALHIPDIPPFEIPSLVSHMPGGVTLISDASQLRPPPDGAPTTPFHGAWVRDGGQQFRFKAEFYQFVEAVLLKVTLREVVTMHGPDQYTGEGTIEVDGSSYGVTTVATRIKAG